jgi:putative ABC transport system ATP-binding protein
VFNLFVTNVAMKRNVCYNQSKLNQFLHCLGEGDLDKINSIKMERVSFKSGGEDILKNINVEFEAGYIHTLIGPSGAGKSTLIKLINRLIDPTEGRVLINGIDINNFDVINLRRKIGMVFQQAHLFDGTVSDNIKYGPLLMGEKNIDVKYYLNIVGLEESFQNKNVSNLSGGEQQRISIARTLANRPEVILLDEPTSALDPTSTQLIEELILQLKNKLNLTFIWITHNMEQAKRVGDFTYLVVGGELVDCGRTGELFENPRKEITRLFIDGKLTGGKSK